MARRRRTTQREEWSPLVREFLSLAPPEGLEIYELIEMMEGRLKQIVGRQRLYTILATMQTRGDIRSTDRAENRRYHMPIEEAVEHAH